MLRHRLPLLQDLPTVSTYGQLFSHFLVVLPLARLLLLKLAATRLLVLHFAPPLSPLENTFTENTPHARYLLITHNL